MAVRDMLTQHLGRAPTYTIAYKEKRAKEELIPKIVEILQRFKCDLCASCCRNAGIDLSPEEAVEMLRLKGRAYFDMLDINSIRDRLKAPCGLLEGNLCSVYEMRLPTLKGWGILYVLRYKTTQCCLGILFPFSCF